MKKNSLVNSHLRSLIKITGPSVNPYALTLLPSGDSHEVRSLYFQSETKALNISNNITYRYKFDKKKGRTLSTRYLTHLSSRSAF